MNSPGHHWSAPCCSAPPCSSCCSSSARRSAGSRAARRPSHRRPERPRPARRTPRRRWPTTCAGRASAAASAALGGGGGDTITSFTEHCSETSLLAESRHQHRLRQNSTSEICDVVPGVKTHTRQSIGLPTALPGPGELEGGGERPRAPSPGPGRAVGNPIDCRVCVFTPGTVQNH